MTICISAIAKEKEKEYIVFSTDHMVSTPIGQFEHSISKYKQINENTVTMLAGNPLIFDPLIKMPSKEKTFEEIKLLIFKNFKDKRKEHIKNEILDIYGVNEKFLIDSLQRPIPNPFINTILERVAKFELNTSIMLVGFDQGVAKIVEIDETGSDELRNVNFHAIGSGATQAMNTLLFQKHSKEDSLLTTIYSVYKAKKNAEVSQGVGRETDLLIFSPNRITRLNEKQIAKLDNIYIEELKYGKHHKDLNSLELEVI